MSLKQDLETNIRAVGAYDAQDYDAALAHFAKIRDTGSKIRFNMGIIYATTGDHELAVEHFRAALELDRYLAVAYFQQGVSNFLLQEYEEAKDNFNDALLYLRGNMLIDYTQLGLKFRLFSCEVLFNRGLCSINLGNVEQGKDDFKYASREKQTGEHDVIEEAMRDEGEGYTVFSIPVGVLYRPDESKVRNLAARDYLGKARLIATSDAGDMGTGFRGYEQKLQSIGLPTSLPPATARGLQPLVASRSSVDAMPTSMYVIQMSKGKRVDSDSSRLIPGLSQDLERKASISSVRSQFRAPNRTFSRKSADLPPTPPLSSGSASRKASSISSSSDTPDRYLPTTSKSAAKAVPRKQASVSNSSSVRALPIIRRESDSSFYEDERSNVPATLPAPSGASRSRSAELRELEEYCRETRDRLISTSKSITYASPGRQTLGKYKATEEMLSRSNVISTTSSAQLDHYEGLVDDYLKEYDSDREHSPKPVRKPTNVTRIKCKIHGLEDARVITVEPYMDIKVFRIRLCEKFSWTKLPKLRIKDEDDELILLADQEDFDHVCEIAVTRAQKDGLEVGRIEVYVKVESAISSRV